MAKLLLLLLLSVISLSTLLHTSISLRAPFSIPIIHRDSPLSPFYNPNATDRWLSAYRRSISRHNLLSMALMSSHGVDSPLSKGIQAPLQPVGGEYIMKLSIGTPPQDVYLSIDTGSDLIWTQCLPCTHCYTQNVPLFDPAKSSTYALMACPSNPCDHLSNSYCVDDKCIYISYYADKSITRGYLTSDTMVFPSDEGDDLSIAEMVFGCGFDNSGTFSNMETGILGLGGGWGSLVSDLGVDLGWQFSYCLTLNKGNGKRVGSQLIFGRNANLQGGYTPMDYYSDRDQYTFYYITLNDISVAGERLNVPPGMFKRRPDGTGGMVIDSGSTLTMLYSGAFDLLVKKLREVIKLEPVEGGSDMPFLCFKGNMRDVEREIPELTFHFDQLDVTLHPVNSFGNKAPNAVCLAMLPSATDKVAVFGSTAQLDKNVAYDVQNRRLYVTDAVC